MQEEENVPLLYAWRSDAPKNPRPKKQAFSSSLRNSTLVIDNGSYDCRVGWAHEEKPALDFRAVLHKPKSKASATGSPSRASPATSLLCFTARRLRDHGFRRGEPSGRTAPEPAPCRRAASRSVEL